MLGDRVRDDGEEYEVIWCGASSRAGVVPSLLGEGIRGSTLSSVAYEQYAVEVRANNRRQSEPRTLTEAAIRRAHQELSER